MADTKLHKVAKNFLIPLFAIVILGLLAWFVMAATNEASTKLESPARETNHSKAQLVLVNFTFENGTAALDVETHIGLLNATVYYNITPTEWAIIGNTTSCITVTLANPSYNISCTGLMNISVNGSGHTIPDGYYSLNATIVNGSSRAEEYRQGISAVGNLTVIRIDNTQPQAVNITTLTSGNNHSTTSLGGNLVLNVSAEDNLAGISAVTFNIVNLTGGLNATLSGAREGASNYWSTNTNTSHYPDGTYNITFMVNDTAGNHNFTANGTVYAARSILTKIIFDNTKPSANAVCSPTTVDTGDAFPCTCTGSDTTAGINTTGGSSTSPQGTGTPTSSGTFTYTCTTTDRAGNIQTATTTYTVIEGGGSGGGSSGGGSSGGSSGGLSPPSSGSSSGSTGPETTTQTGSEGAQTGEGAAGAAGQEGTRAAAGGLGTGILIAIVIAAIVVVVIVVMLKHRKLSTVKAKM